MMIQINNGIFEVFVYHSYSDRTTSSDSMNYVTTILCVSVNLGGLLLQALLEFWPRTHINPVEEEEIELNHGRLFLFFCKGIFE